jgi:hypothetical protein
VCLRSCIATLFLSLLLCLLIFLCLLKCLAISMIHRICNRLCKIDVFTYIASSKFQIKGGVVYDKISEFWLAKGFWVAVIREVLELKRTYFFNWFLHPTLL